MVFFRIPLAMLCILASSASVARPVVSYFQLPARGSIPDALTNVPGTQEERVGRTDTILQIPTGVNDFAGKNVPKYLLPNGAQMQFSGGFRPGEGVTCISDCPGSKRR